MSYSHYEARSRDREPLASVPPAMIDETGWDIVLALRSDRCRKLSLRKLAAIISVPNRVLDQWLARLEERELITGAADQVTGELFAILTPTGRALLDRYLAAASDLHVRTLN